MEPEHIGKRARECLRDWLLPALVAAFQLAFWPGLKLRAGETPAAPDLVVCLAVAAVTSVALGLRRRRPVASALAVEAGLLVGLPAAEDATLMCSLAVVVALYSVAVHRPLGTAVLVTSVLLVSAGLRCVVRYDSLLEAGGEALVNFALYATAVGLGRGRARWYEGRLAAAQDLRRAEAARATAATSERTRLARELHDVSAHHLTSVVVTVDAARRLGDRRPELAEEALRFAAEGGRETMAALHRLVTAMRTSATDEESALEDRIAELAAGFARLGLRPAVRVAPPLAGLTGPVAEAAFGIVREALTNALRYAPSAAVRVEVSERDGTLQLTVDDDGPGGSAPGPRRDGLGSGPDGLGSGRGTTGMRERAAALGGTLTVGPRKGAAGWSVRASLPRTPAAAHHLHTLRPERSADLAIVLALAAIPLFVVLTLGVVPFAVAVLPAALHALPLLWRRQQPWRVLLGVLAAAWLAPAALALGVVEWEAAWALGIGGAFADGVALYSVAAHAGRARDTWSAILMTASGLAAALVVLGELSDFSEFSGDVSDPAGFLTFMTVLVTALLVVLLAPVWALGAAVRARRERIRGREHSALAATVQGAVVEAYEERQRIAAELRGAVLRRAEALVQRAGTGDLDGCAEQARAGLSAMRELLAALRELAAPPMGPAAPTVTMTRPTHPSDLKETSPSLSEC
ncbi:sensor histidine kinase [Streptomyces sp. NBC_01304]|uniref:sensor histidine kinase n=1 Tax=Streptomyces sp. NBC_01304 TaxID=2903818 RepID=UPI002E13EBC8|nr:sensor histidine kinase [Streptomyces sp. NBC_01304]